MSASGWNFFAFVICCLNQVLASSCSISSKLAWLSSICLYQSGMLCRQRLYIRYAYLPVQLKKRQLLPLAMPCLSLYRSVLYPTISSLHIGQTSRELAAAAAWAEPCSSRATRDVRSSFSVDMGVLEVCELNDTELSEGDSRPICLGWGGCGGGGAARPFPLPSTRPPPRLLRAAMAVSYYFPVLQLRPGSMLRWVRHGDVSYHCSLDVQLE